MIATTNRRLTRERDRLKRANAELETKLAYIRQFVAPEYAPNLSSLEETYDSTEVRVVLSNDEKALMEFYVKHFSKDRARAEVDLQRLCKWEAFHDDPEISRNPEAASLLAYLRLVLHPRGLKGLDFHEDAAARLAAYLERAAASRLPIPWRLVEAYNALNDLVEVWKRDGAQLRHEIEQFKLVGAAS